MARLRAPGGCPWDRSQSRGDLKTYLVEETYEVLDAIVEGYMEQDLSPREIIGRGFAEADVRRVVRLLRISEYKRRQAPVGIRVTQRGFGKDWRFPITNRYRDPY